MRKQKINCDFETKIRGIPCKIKVTDFYPGYAGNKSRFEPPEDMEVDFEVFDRKGYRAEWLERKMTEKDEAKVIEEILDYQGD